MKPAAMAVPVSEIVTVNQQNRDNPAPARLNPDLRSFLPFMSKGYVLLVGSSDKMPVVILRDTAAYDSFILESVLPFLGKTDTGAFIPVRGMGM